MKKRIVGVGAVSVAVWLSHAYAGGGGDYWNTVELQGNANLTNIGAGSSDANTSIGVYAEHDTSDGMTSLIGAFSFGARGTSITAGSREDYVSFLEQPTSTLGGQVKAARGWYVCPPSRVMVGLAVNLRAFSVSMAPSEGAASQRLNLLAIDPSVFVHAGLDAKRNVSLTVEAGLASRFWNKPGSAFTTALDVPSSHAYVGPRVAAFISVGSIYAGVELTRYFGQDGLESLREFSIVPLVGVRGSLELETGSGAGEGGGTGSGGVLDESHVRRPAGSPDQQPATHASLPLY